MRRHLLIFRLMAVRPKTKFSTWSETRRMQFSSAVPRHRRVNERNNSQYRPAGFWKERASHLVDSRPCLANALNTGLVMGLGDLLAQVFLESKGMTGFDFSRASRFVALGVVLAGPGMFYWYSALDKHVVSGSRVSTMLRKMLLDQVLFLPLYLLLYFVVLAAFRREGADEIKEKVRRDLYPCLVDSYKVWPLAQAINFYLLPLRFRIFFINFIALFWNAYIGWKAEQKI